MKRFLRGFNTQEYQYVFFSIWQPTKTVSENQIQQELQANLKKLPQEEIKEFERLLSIVQEAAQKDPFFEFDEPSIINLGKSYESGRKYRQVCAELTRVSFEDKDLADTISQLIDNAR